MTFKTRRFLFWGLLFIFLGAGFLIVSYSRGWRVDFGQCSLGNLKSCQFKIEKSGAIYLQTRPRGVIIKINGKIFDDKSGLIQAGTLIGNLTPGTYRVEVAKDGYFTWRKNLLVRPELVAEAENIVLVPQKINKESVGIPRLRGQQIESAANDGSRFILKEAKSGLYYLYDSSDFSVVFNINFNFRNLSSGGQTIKKAAVHPFDPNKIIVETDRGIYLLDTLRLNLEEVLHGPPLVLDVTNSNIFYIKKEIDAAATTTPAYTLNSWNLVIKNGNPIFTLPDYLTAQMPFIRLETAPLQTKFALLAQNGTLYLLDQTDSSVKKIGSDALDFAFSPDSKKIAELDKDGKLSVLFLEDSPNNNPKKAGDVLRLTAKSQPRGLSWYADSYHLFLSSENNLELTEIDDRLPTNNYNIENGTGGNFYHDSASNFVFRAENKNLFRLSLQ